MRFSLVTVAAAVATISFLLKDDPQIAGLGYVVSLVSDCVSGQSPWCDAGLPLALGNFGVFAAVDPWTKNAAKIATDHVLKGGEGLAGKVAIVTGASAGIGVETARVLLSHGCRVIMAVRNVDKGQKVLSGMIKEAGSSGISGEGTVLELDLADLKSVRRFATKFKAMGLPLSLLINNAGVMIPSSDNTEVVSPQGRELQFDTNHVGHFLLTKLLEDKLLASGTADDPARVVYVSSEGSAFWNGPSAGPDGGLADQVPPTRAYQGMHNYCLSKALNVLTAKEQQRRWNATNAIAVSVHPGLIPTGLLDNSGPVKGGFYSWLFAYARKSVGQGASTTIYAALAPVVVTDARAGWFYFANNKKAIQFRPDLYSDKTAKEAWERTERLL